MTSNSYAFVTMTTTISPPPSTKRPDYSFVWMYISPFILVIGVIGNTLTLSVMSRRLLKHSTTRIYLSAMAVADSCALFWRILPECMRASKIFDFSTLNVWTCRLEHFSFYTSSDAAIWFMVSFTIDRLVAVCFPLQKKRICKKKSARRLTASVLVCAISKNIHIFWTRGFNPAIGPQITSVTYQAIQAGGSYTDSPEQHRTSSNNFTSFSASVTSNNAKQVCMRLTEYSFFEETIRPLLAFTIISALPTIILIICNMLIIKALLKVYKFRKDAVESCRKDSYDGLFESAEPQQSQKQLVLHFVKMQHLSPERSTLETSASQRSMSNVSASQTTSVSMNNDKTVFTHASFMCIAVSVAFLVCVAPSIILTIGRKSWQHHRSYNIIKTINNQLACINHAANFFLYCVTGQRFRYELLYMLRLRTPPRSYFDDPRRRINHSPSLWTAEQTTRKTTSTKSSYISNTLINPSSAHHLTSKMSPNL